MATTTIANARSRAPLLEGYVHGRPQAQPATPPTTPPSVSRRPPRRTSSLAAHLPRGSSRVDANGLHVVESRRHWRRHARVPGTRPRPVPPSLVGLCFNCLPWIMSQRSVASPHSARARSTMLGHENEGDCRPWLRHAVSPASAMPPGMTAAGLALCRCLTDACEAEPLP